MPQAVRLFTETPRARESSEPLEILELLYWFELELTDQATVERLLRATSARNRGGRASAPGSPSHLDRLLARL